MTKVNKDINSFHIGITKCLIFSHETYHQSPLKNVRYLIPKNHGNNFLILQTDTYYTVDRSGNTRLDLALSLK